MKMIRAITAAAILAASFASPAAIAPAAAQESGNSNWLGYCNALVESGQFGPLNLGECMSYNIVEGPGWRTKICDALLELDLLDQFGFDSFPDCVRNVY